jgi:hypothetical protein
MVIFTKDAQVILGLSAEEYAAQALLAVLKSHAGSDVGYITVEGPPPQTAAEFRRIARESSG